MVIVGASANHWYYNNLIYRSAITALILCGCCGVNGGGINHYVGQEKLAPVAPWIDACLRPRLGQAAAACAVADLALLPIAISGATSGSSPSTA